MNSQISLAMFVALCLSNASSSVIRRSAEKENITLDRVESEIRHLNGTQKQAILQFLQNLESSLKRNESATNESQSNDTSLQNDSVSPTQPNKTTSDLSGNGSTPSTKAMVTKANPTAKSTTVQLVLSTTQKTKKTTTKSSKKSTTQKATENKTTKTTVQQVPRSTTQTTTQNIATRSSTKSAAKEAPTTTQTKTQKTITKTPTISSLNDTQGGNTSDASANTDQSQQSSSDHELVHRRSIFPVFFMVMLVVVVAVYFVYHNKSKIHGLIREGYGKAKQTGTSYVKVKLEDDIDLPREANRQYVY